MHSSGKGRRRSPRARVYYLEDGRLRPGDLIYKGEQPILVVKWKTVGARREPELFFALERAHLWPVAQREREYVYRGRIRE